jgi:methylated-DNA-[protein]-cysteine S-methyltransferase
MTMAHSGQAGCRSIADNGEVNSLAWATLDTPVGPVSVGCGDAGVARVRFGPPPGDWSPDEAAPDETPPDETPPDETPPDEAAVDEAAVDEAAPDETPPDEAAPDETASRRELARAARRQLAEYFCGQRKEFDLPLDWSGFAAAQRQVLGLLQEDVGWGQTVTYGNLAALAGIPASTDVIPARTVGQIMGSNPIPVIVPCHRVVASDGIGGYSGGAGPEVKRWLLILEGSVPPTLDWTPASPPAD